MFQLFFFLSSYWVIRTIQQCLWMCEWIRDRSLYITRLMACLLSPNCTRWVPWFQKHFSQAHGQSVGDIPSTWSIFFTLQSMALTNIITRGWEMKFRGSALPPLRHTHTHPHIPGSALRHLLFSFYRRPIYHCPYPVWHWQTACAEYILFMIYDLCAR